MPGVATLALLPLAWPPTTITVGETVSFDKASAGDALSSCRDSRISISPGTCENLAALLRRLATGALRRLIPDPPGQRDAINRSSSHPRGLRIPDRAFTRSRPESHIARLGRLGRPKGTCVREFGRSCQT